jgi:hypothetical protein
MALITLFTAPKPFTNPHIALIQRNALRSWQALGPEVEVVLIGQEEGLADAAAELGFAHRSDVARNALGTPLVSAIFELGRSFSQSPLLAYVNADIILLSDFVQAARAVSAACERFLIVGQRWDLEVTKELSFTPGWEAVLRAHLQSEGKRHLRAGSDYFIFPRKCFEHIPDFSIGRAGWDNWMIYEARRQSWAVVDATPDVDIIHQNHDYSHLPNSQPHYRLPETGENIRLAGGRRTLFNLDDATHQLVHGQLVPFPRSWQKFWREVEIHPLLAWGNYSLTQVLFTLFHPRRAWYESKRQRQLEQTTFVA